MKTACLIWRRAAGHKYFVLHSPTDFIKIQQAQNAVEKLKNADAQTRLKTYNGGHGWTEDPYGNIKTGINWLEGNK